jgi:hypothetical protein
MAKRISTSTNRVSVAWVGKVAYTVSKIDANGQIWNKYCHRTHGKGWEFGPWVAVATAWSVDQAWEADRAYARIMDAGNRSWR